MNILEESMANSLLVCVDLMPHSRAVVKKAVELGKNLKSKIILIHVRDESPTGSHSSSTHSTATAKELIKENNEMEKLEEYLRDSGLEFTSSQPKGDVMKILKEKVQETDPLFVVMGSVHNSALHHLVSGSIAGTLLEKSKIPVLLVPEA